MSKLVDFLQALGRDADLADAYEADPEGTMTKYGLTAEEREAVASGDVEKVKQLSGLDDVHLTNGTIKAYD